MSKLQVDDIVNKDDTGSVGFSRGAVVTGVCTATTFSGDGSGLTGVASTDFIITGTAATFNNTTELQNVQLVGVTTGLNVSGVATFASNVSIAGTLTYEDVTNIDSVGIVTARTGVEVTANGLVVNAGVSTFAADVSIADKIVHTGDTNTAIRFPSADTITAETAGTERLRITSGGDVTLAGIATVFGATGIVSATSYFGSGANLTGINVAPSFTGIASGSISDGDPVVVLSSGLIEKIGPNNTNRGSYSAGSEVNIDATQSSYVATAYDTTENKILVAANDDNDSSGRVRAVTPQSNGSYTVGSEFVYSTDDAIHNSLTYDSNADKTVVFYHDGGNSNRGTANVLNLSGSTITGGSDVVFSTLDTRDIDSVFDPDSNKIIVVYKVDNSGTNDVRCRVATVDPSDNSVSFGTEVTIKSNAKSPSVTYDTANNKVVVAYVDGGDAEKGKAVVGTVSGTDISFGTPVQFEADTTDEIRTVFSTDQSKVVIAYQNETDSNNIDMIAGTVSGTSISFGSVISATTTDDTEIDLFYHPQTFVIFLASRAGGSYGDAKLFGFTLSGTTLSASHSVTYRSAGTSYNSIQDFPDSERIHIFYKDGAGGTNLRVNPVEVTSYGSNLVNNFCGIADAAYSDGQTVTVQTIGAVDDAQSGMTPGTPMYVSGQTGAITSTSSGNQFIGLAISATKLLIAKAGLDIT